ncbi:hypothetical protein GGX14DRAFT_647424 [Mycena pura]|uniref:Uncharacterized protein n=1 Tax=Mycena pura TaxID=153505 RepID=A0AAD6V787_9AGAR|nr:hypothetical protein GGX14DRAFT_647424 [Mycena pura]
MVFRLPTHLDNFIPPPRAQPRPWRGTLTVRGMRASDPGSNQEIRVTAVETDGDSDVRRWPLHFFAQIAHGHPVLREVRAWVQQNAPPISTFMPDRLPDPDANVVNTANFRSLSRMLYEQQLVAIAPWGIDSFPGGGLIIIPAEHSSALLVAALFFAQFPDILGTTRLSLPAAPPQQQQHPQHHNPYAAYPGTSASAHASSSAMPMPGSTHISQHYRAGAGPSFRPPARSPQHAHVHALAHGVGARSQSPVDREQPISRFRVPVMPAPMPLYAASPHAAWPAPAPREDAGAEAEEGDAAQSAHYAHQYAPRGAN